MHKGAVGRGEGSYRRPHRQMRQKPQFVPAGVQGRTGAWTGWSMQEGQQEGKREEASSGLPYAICTSAQ